MEESIPTDEEHQFAREDLGDRPWVELEVAHVAKVVLVKDHPQPSLIHSNLTKLLVVGSTDGCAKIGTPIDSKRIAVETLSIPVIWLRPITDVRVHAVYGVQRPWPRLLDLTPRLDPFGLW